MFEQEIIDSIKSYAERDLPKQSFYDNLFKFITDNNVRNLIIKEFKNIRFMYKIFEGIQAENELLYFETKTQIIMYASVEEAVLSWVLFNYFSSSQEVQELLKITTLKRYSIPQVKKKQLENALKHDSKEIIPCYEEIIQKQKEKVRFDSKVEAAFKLGLISKGMKDDLISIFEYRNTVHIEAAIKKNLDYSLKMSKKAYRRVEGLNIELEASLKSLGKYN